MSDGEECRSCDKRFYFYSIKEEHGDATLSIPAVDSLTAERILEGLVTDHSEWTRELKLEESMQAKTTGRIKAMEDDGPGAMFG